MSFLDDLPDFSSVVDSGTFSFPDLPAFDAGPFSSLPPVLNLPSTGNTGFTGLMKDITNLVSNVYAGEAQVANAQAGLKMTQAQNALALRNVTQAPSMWMVLGLGGAALLAIVLVEKSHK